ncbi:uncharacterized protein LOC141601884 [Silene latifolia]|uniref:uncharacterized protein LOC141601884 n=1 Tax=Silene latifolia TaxID=37657 RepID=UPI003D775D1A
MARPTQVENAIMQALTQVLANQQNAQPAPIAPEANRQGSYAWIASQLARNKAKTYGGEVDPVALSEWFRDMEKNFSLFDAREEDKVKLASHFLVKEADRWWTLTGPTATQDPNFDWNRFKSLVETRFYPKELKQQRLKEFMDFKQGKLSIQAYTDKFNELAHYASKFVKDEEDRVYFYKNKLNPKVESMVRRSSTTFVEVYDDAIWAESSLKAIEEDSKIHSSSHSYRSNFHGKRPFVPSTPNYANKRRFVPRMQDHGGQGPRVQEPRGQVPSPTNELEKDRKCYHCRQALHPGVGCYGKPLTCFHCTFTTYAPGPDFCGSDYGVEALHGGNGGNGGYGGYGGYSSYGDGLGSGQNIGEYVTPLQEDDSSESDQQGEASGSGSGYCN